MEFKNLTKDQMGKAKSLESADEMLEFVKNERKAEAVKPSFDAE